MAPRTDGRPCAEIIAELQRRIETGELAPGDRVPSTRQITRHWGVAMATATKALTTLRHEGLVRAVPGVGTLVEGGLPTAALAGPPSTPAAGTAGRRTGSEPLALDRIVVAAMSVADAEGLAALSMRRVAAEIGVATMSLYRHVAAKDELVVHMMDAAFVEMRLPADPPNHWRGGLELAARMLWATFRAHPWLAPALSLTRPQPTAGGMAYTEWVLTALDRLGLDLPTMFTVDLTLFNYVRGTAVHLDLEADAEAVSGLSNEEWMDTQNSRLRSIVTAERFPMLERVHATTYDFDLDALFEFGLQRLLDGLTVFLRDRR